MKTKEIGIERVTNAITTMVNQVARDARKEALEEVAQMLWAKAEMIEKVLDNGRDIWIASTGIRHEMLYQQRNVLWSRAILLNQMAGEIMTIMKKD